jgi:glutamate--cysteine ligase
LSLCPLTTGCIMNSMDTEQIYAYNRDAIASYLAEGELEPAARRLGFELEHFIVESSTHLAVAYHDRIAPDGTLRYGIAHILTLLTPFYERVIAQEGTDGETALIGLERDKAVITLEPGAQLEISIGPARDVAEIERVYTAFRAELDQVIAPLGYEVVLLGYHPTARAYDVELLPKARYHLMDAHFSSTGRHGICMMRGSASTQVSIDYQDEADAMCKLRIANLIGPLLAFMTDNAPVFEGSLVTTDTTADTPVLTSSGLPLPMRMVRTAIWNDVDPDRSGAVDLWTHRAPGYRGYAEAIMDAPAILTMEPEATAWGFATIKEIYADRLLTRADIEHLLSMFFFDARMKRYIEIRMADALPPHLAFAYSALIEGLFYVPENLAFLDLVLPAVRDVDLPAVKENLMTNGYEAQVYGRTAASWLDELIALADNTENPDRVYLEPLTALIAARRTPLTQRSIAR